MSTHKPVSIRFLHFLYPPMGVASSANLLTIYFFYEMLSVSTFPLVTHADRRLAQEAELIGIFFLLLCVFTSCIELVLCMADGGQMTMDFLADTGKIGE